MKRLHLLLIVCCLQAAICHSQTPRVRVDLSQAGKKVTPRQFGIFFEEINHAGDGGIYSELVRNGSFTEAETLDAWSRVQAGSATVSLFFDAEMPLNAVKTRSLRIEIDSPAGDRAGVSNEGYWGIAAAKGHVYQFSMDARAAAGFDGPLTVALESKDGAVYGETQINGLKTAWNHFTGSIQSDATDPAARLTITAKHSGTFWINTVSLRPGSDLFRADLLEKVKALKPGFLRFPGGTYVQGNDRGSAFRWKTTIGNLADRAGHKDEPWSYWSTDSMGFYEYLLLCERLGAAPYYVSYAGMTWTPSPKSPFGFLDPNRIPVDDYPLDQMGPIVQDALDAIEFANGPVTGKWGALRAKYGHPAPFGLKFIEIGNEDGSNPLYKQRYMLFYNAIKARYPDVEIVANDNHRNHNRDLPQDLLDEHMYASPLKALDFAKELDTRPRDAHKSVLAEMAVSTSAGYGNQRAALAQAVMMMSIERNSEVMPMASYAPLLANVRAINWRPDLIYFNSSSSYGNPPYYVETMFADTPLASVVPVQVTAPEVEIPMTGKAHAEGYDAQAEFQNEKTAGSGDDTTYTVRARKTGGDGGLVIRFAGQDDGSYLAWFLGVVNRASTLRVWGGGGNLDVPVDQLEQSFAGALAPPVKGTIDTDRWYDIEIRVQGRRVQCFLDGKLIHDVQVPETLGPSLYGTAGRTAAGDVVVRLVNISPEKQNVSLDLGGARRYSVVASSLTAQNLDAENSFADPTRIAPIQRLLPAVDGNFQYEVQGNSFTVLKLTPQGK
ncbi:MAG: alpha-L-arabinofuranosidase C-terminal domain-containing protein [Acidobacteriota bacterium]